MAVEPKPPEKTPAFSNLPEASSAFSGIRDKLAGIVVDTITTRFLLLFLFMLVIPLAAVIIFTVPFLENSLEEASQRQLELSQNALHWSLGQNRERLSMLSTSDCNGAVPTCRVLPWSGLQDPEDNFAVLDKGLYMLRFGQALTGQGVALPVDQSMINRIYQYQPDLEVDIWIVAEPMVQKNRPVFFARTDLQRYSLPELQLLEQLSGSRPDTSQTLIIDNNAYQIRQEPLYGPNHERVARVLHILPRSHQQFQLDNYYTGIYLITVLSLVFSVLLSMVAGRTITQPLLKLISQVNTLSRVTVMKDEVAVRGVYEINQLGDAFNRMVKRLQQEHKMKDEFVATLTHDLKVPLIAEKQTLAYFQQNAYGPLNEEQQEVVSVLQSSNRSCLSLVNGLLEVYRYNSGEVTLVHEVFNLAQLLEETIQEVQSLALEKSILLELATDVDDDGEAALVFADRLEIKRVLHNLVSNAITNTPPRGKISCRITDAEHYGNASVYKVSDFQSTTLKAPIKLYDRLMVIVQDSGLGFSNEDFPTLFKQFAASKGRNPMSIGLGLFNSYQVIGAHNGVLWVESTEGEGSTVSFVLPKNKDTAQDRRVYADRRKNA